MSLGALAAFVLAVADGGEGQDTINGGNGGDTLNGGPGADTIDGNQGTDNVFLGSGDDTARWDPGDGSDNVDGENGDDTLLFNGSAAAEIFTISPNGGNVLLTRNVGNIVMALTSTEEIDLNALGGADTVTVNDLSATGVTNLTVDLAVNTAGDAAVDLVEIFGDSNPNVFSAAASGSRRRHLGAPDGDCHHRLGGGERHPQARRARRRTTSSPAAPSQRSCACPWTAATATTR